MIAYVSTDLTMLGHRSWQVDITYGDLVLETTEHDTKAKAESYQGHALRRFDRLIKDEQDFWSRDHSDCATISRGIGDPVTCACPVRDQVHLQSWYEGQAGTTTKGGIEVSEGLVQALVRASLPYAHSNFEQHALEMVLVYLHRATEDLEQMTRPVETT